MNRESATTDTLSLDIPSIVMDVLRQWWNILLVALSAALLAAAFFMTFPTIEYSSSTVLAISTNNGSVVRNVTNANKVAASLTNVLNADVLKRLVAEDTGWQNYTASADYIADTNLITLSVKSDSPRKAFSILESVLDHYEVLLEDVMSDVRLVTLQAPSIPASRTLPARFAFYIAVAFVAGAVLAIGVIVLLSVLRDTVKNSEEVKTKIDTRSLGTIPFVANEEGKNKFGKELPFLYGERVSFRFRESFQITAARILRHMDSKNRKVLMVTSVLPNEGKTTCTVNLAIAMAQSNRKVLLIDGDFRNPSVADALKINNEYQNRLAEALESGGYDEMMLYQVSDLQLYCIASRTSHEQSAMALSNGNFEKLLNYGRENFDMVLVDSGPVSLVADNELMKSLCDAVILVVAQDAAPARIINDAVDMLDEHGKLMGCIFKETRPAVGKRRAGYEAYHQPMKEDR